MIVSQVNEIKTNDDLEKLELLRFWKTRWYFVTCMNSFCMTLGGSLQIGRSTESPIDFVVTDTSGGAKDGEDPSIAPSTISRFACRIVCERNPPYTARIYAAGFDSSKNIFLGVSRTTSSQRIYF